ncbi:MAG: Ig-like domain-containing protein [Sandaracinus sp.]|nr:Ig-like domain-containing protein [Sandaracinus sp.]
MRVCNVLQVALAASLALVVPMRASANGIVSHMTISDLAVRHLPPGELRDLMTDPELVRFYRAGSVFPDSGYAADDAYGEICHWEPFTTAYVRWIRENFGDDLSSPEARVHVAFLMGQASHGMADQVFDSLFMARSEQYDGDASNLDTGAEGWLVVEHDPMNQIEGYIDGTAMVDVFGDYPELLDAHDPTTDTFERGRTQITRAIGAIYAFGWTWYDMYWVEMPWAATHYYEADNVPGSLPHIATYVSRYWEVLWERVHGRDTLGESFVGTWPEDGAVNFETDRDRIESRAMIVFGHGLDRSSFSGNVRLLDPEGTSVPAEVRFIYGSPFANAILVRPNDDLAYDTEYTVEVGTGVRDIDGRAIPEPVSFSYRTRCAPESLGDCPPLPEEWVRPEDPMPPPRDAGTRTPRDAGTDAGPADAGAPEEDAGIPTAGGGGGCATSNARGGLAGLAFAALWLLRRRRSTH